MTSFGDCMGKHLEPSGGQSRATSKRRYLVAIALGGLLLLATLMVVVFWQLFCRPYAVHLIVDTPSEVYVGEAFKMSVVIRNESNSDTVIWTGVEIDDNFIRGYPQLSAVLSQPSWTNIDYVSGSRSFKPSLLAFSLTEHAKIP